MSDRALTLARAESFQVPALVADVGPEATKRFFEFFTVPIRNKNTRIAYYHAIGQFLAWCERGGFHNLEDRIHSIDWPFHNGEALLFPDAG
jgi:hypothetical protein